MEDSLLLFQPQGHEDDKPRWPRPTIGINPGKAIFVFENCCPFSPSLHLVRLLVAKSKGQILY